MAQRVRIAPHLSRDALEPRYRRCRAPVERSQWQMLWLLAGGVPTAEVARATGSSGRWGQEIARRDRAGPAAIGDRRHTTPGAAPWLNRAQQEALRAALGGAAPAGGPWTCRSVAAWMSQTLGRPVSEQRGWDWMRRLGVTPQRPRPREPRGDPAAQEAFKKGGLPPSSPR